MRERIDGMSNPEYQRLLRAGRHPARAVAGRGRRQPDARRLIADLDDAELSRAIRDLGGHDLSDLLGAFAEADAAPDRPSVIFAYTIKAWRLATEGHPANHSALLTGEQWRRSPASGCRRRRSVGDVRRRHARRPSCAAAARRLARPESRPRRHRPSPRRRPHRIRARASTQQALGRFFVDLARGRPSWPHASSRSAPMSASSTNLGGWINRVGRLAAARSLDWFADDTDTLVRWPEGEHGQHIELGIAEGNLVGLLGELGLTWSRDGRAAATDRHPL